jgi:hypothetical protein
MGIHAGRARSAEEAAMMATMGCIRTSDAAMQAINALHMIDPLTHILVDP